jgi:hypothetical protein
MSAEDTERSTQLRRLRLAGPLGRHAARERTSATSVLPQSGSQQQLASHAPAFKLHTHVQSNFVQGLRSGGVGSGGGGGEEGGGGANGAPRRTCSSPRKSTPAAATPTKLGCSL